MLQDATRQSAECGVFRLKHEPVDMTDKVHPQQRVCRDGCSPLLSGLIPTAVSEIKEPDEALFCGV